GLEHHPHRTVTELLRIILYRSCHRLDPSKKSSLRTRREGSIPGTLAIRVFPRLCNVRSTDSHANTNAVAPAATKISGDSWPSNPAVTTATDNNTNRPTIY